VQVRNLVRNRHLATSIGDVGWAQWRTTLASTAAGVGKRVVAVPPADTGQGGSGCGERALKRLSVRTHVCPACELVLDRDANAAVNILRAGPSGANVGRWAGGPRVA
jgi:putative transposase